MFLGVNIRRTIINHITIKYHDFLLFVLFFLIYIFFFSPQIEKPKLAVFQKQSASEQKRHMHTHTATHTLYTDKRSAFAPIHIHTHTHTYTHSVSCSLTTDSQHYWKVEFNHPFLLSHCNPCIYHYTFCFPM